jgi:hypothetical protein
LNEAREPARGTIRIAKGSPIPHLTPLREATISKRAYDGLPITVI